MITEFHFYFSYSFIFVKKQKFQKNETFKIHYKPQFNNCQCEVLGNNAKQWALPSTCNWI